MNITETAKTIALHFNTEKEAREIKEKLAIRFEEYEVLRVTDVFAIMGFENYYINPIYGWNSMAQISVRKVFGKSRYIIRFPKPVCVD